MIKKADSDRDGVVSRDEFISLIGGPVAQWNWSISALFSQ